MKYEDLIFKIPVESKTYKEDSDFVIKQMISILDNRKKIGDNKIIINTNLKRGLPLENINKIAGPMIEAWSGEVFDGIRDYNNNTYNLINVEAQERLGMADIILQFRKNDRVITGNVDVKATANDIPNSGKGPNITSFSRIRTAYVIDPDYMFIILSIKHRVYSERNKETGLVVLWVKLNRAGYTRSITSLYREMVRQGIYKKTPSKKKQYVPKPYEQMKYPGQRVQIDVKYVPQNCMSKELQEREEKYYQYTAIDEYTRQRVLWASKEHSSYEASKFVKIIVKKFKYPIPIPPDKTAATIPTSVFER